MSVLKEKNLAAVVLNHHQSVDSNENKKKFVTNMRETKSKSVYFLFTPWLEGNQLRRRKLSIHNATSLKFELNFRKLLRT